MSDSKVKISNILESQLPGFILEDNPLFKEFLEQYYLSQQHEYGTIDLGERIQDLKNIQSIVDVKYTQTTPTLTKFIANDDDLIEVTNHVGFIEKNGLVKIGSEIFTYTGKTSFAQKVIQVDPTANTIRLTSTVGLDSFRAQTIIFDTAFSSVVAGKVYYVTEVIDSNTITISENEDSLDDVLDITEANPLGTTLPTATNFAFTGCIRGFSGIDDVSSSEFLNFNVSQSEFHDAGTPLTNLSLVFLAEFFRKYKKLFLPGIEDRQFQSVNIDNILSRARDFYSSKGTDTSLKILFAVLFGKYVDVVKPFDNTIQASSADYSLSDVIVVDTISGDANKLGETTILQGSVDNPTASGVISRVEPLLLNNKYYHKLFFPKNAIQNTFNVSKQTRVLGVGSSLATLTVDSTLGFPESGSFLNPHQGNLVEVSYTSKSANQFYGCVGLSTMLKDNDPITDGQYVFGFENNDEDQLVTMRVVGTIIGVSSTGNVSSQFRKGDELTVKHLGEKVEEDDVRFNRWFYNNVVLQQVDEVIGSSDIRTRLDHHLHVDDKVDIILQNDNSFVSSATVSVVNNRKQFSLVGLSTSLNVTEKYLFKKKLKFVNSNINPSDILGNIQNTFVDADKNAYVAFSGLPGYDNVTVSDRSKTFEHLNINPTTDEITINAHNFERGEKVYFETTAGVSTVTEGSYYTHIVDDNTIKLAFSRSSLDSQIYVGISSGSTNSKYKLTPDSLRGKTLLNQNHFKKINKEPKPALEHTDIIGPIGVSLNGVEFDSPISSDSIYYGQIDNINILNAGTGYDVVNAPQIGVADTAGSSGADLIGQFKGKIEDIIVTAPGFNYADTPTVKISGGNGTQAIAEARMRGLSYSETFADNARDNQESDIITFSSDHRFADGEEIIYTTTGNPIGVGSTSVGFGTDRLTSGARYFVAKLNDTQLSLATSKEKALAKTVINMNAFGNGVHKLTSTVNRRVIDDIRIISSTDDFSNKKVIVDAQAWPPFFQRDIYKTFVGINTQKNYIYARNHSFKSGDNVEYSFTGQSIAGLSSALNYKVTVLDEDRFQLSEAGTATTISSVNYDNKNYVNMTDVGGGTHTFKYPDITVSINGIVSTGNTDITPSYYNAIGVPVVRGGLENVFIRNGGVGYGVSNVMNYQKDIIVEVKTGNNAVIKTIVVDGKITGAYVVEPGLNYTSPPTIKVTGEGVLAELTVTIVNGSITGVTIVNPGQGYTQESTTVEVIPSGTDALLGAEVHKWTFNNVVRYKEALELDSLAPKNNRLNREMIQMNSGFSQKESKLVSFYPGAFYRTRLGDNTLADGTEKSGGPGQELDHSPILGWAYDGNPIYGPYGYANATFDGAANGGIARMRSGYDLDPEPSSLLRPTTGFSNGDFTQDFVYKRSTGTATLKTLDEYNGRFCQTPEYPKGTYAYFSTLDSSNELAYPYITKSHYNQSESFNYEQNTDQRDSILNSGSYRRNVTHLGLNTPTREYPALQDAMRSDVLVNVDQVRASRIDDVIVLESGVNYKVGEQVNFNEPSIDVEVEQVKGKNIVSIGTSDTVLENTIFSVKGQVVTGVTTTPHGFSDGDIIEISGIGSASYKNLEGFPTIGVGTVLTNMKVGVAVTATTGISTFIELAASVFTEKFEKGDIVKISGELMEIVGVDIVNNRYRVTRIVNNSTGSTHGVGDLVVKQPVTFTYLLDKKVQNKNIELPEVENFGASAVGIGSTYTSVVVGTAGSIPVRINIPERAIYLPGHKFKTGDELKLVSIGGTIRGTVKDTMADPFFLPSTGLFAVRLSNEFLGIATSKAFAGITSTLFFHQDTDGTNHTLSQVKDNITGIVKKVSARVETSEAHGIEKGDEVRLHITPNEVQQFEFKFNDYLKKLVVDPKTFAPSGITTGITTSNITIVDHGLNTGDLVIYTNVVGVATPLQDNREYYVIKIDDDTFRLADNAVNSRAFPFQNIVITEQGHGTHEIAKVNPQLDVINGGRFTLKTGDTTLSGYEINFYNDKEFQSRYESTLFKREGVIGDGTDASQIVFDINKDLPGSFYYRLEGVNNTFTDTYPSSVDETVSNYSNIRIVESKFNQNYKVASVGLGTDYSFGFTLVGSAETNSYVPAGYSTGFYSTSSPTAIGPIHSTKVVNGGINVKEFPAITSIGTTTGISAELELTNTEIGSIIDGVVVSPGIEFPVDKTIAPKADSSLILRLKNIRSLKGVGIVTAGKNYNVAPKVIAIGNDNIVTRTTLGGGAVSDVEVISSDSNLEEDLKIIATENSNGIGIVNAVSSNGVAQLFLRAPNVGFGSTNPFPFQTGDKIFVENVQITDGDTADGYNSSDYNYAIFGISTTNTTNGVESISYPIGDLNNGGTYNIAQNAQFGRAIKVDDLATFEPEFAPIRFSEGEKVVASNDGTIFGTVAKNGWDEESGILRLNKVNGKFTEDTIVLGSIGGAKATIAEVTSFDFDFSVGSVSCDNGVWMDDVGKLNDNLQRLHDNDYYQRFAYSIRGEVALDDWKETIDSLDHTAGYKNFADLQLISLPSKTANVSIADTELNLNVDIDSISSVHTRISYDLAKEDTDTTALSKIITFDSKIITDYNESITNKVLMIDDLSSQFNGIGNSSGQLVGLSTFTIFSDGKSLLHHSVNPVTGIAGSTITVTDHQFNTGEELLYDPTNAGINTGSRLSIGSTEVPGIGLTTLLPDRVFAVTFPSDPGLTKDTFKVAISQADVALGRFVTFTNTTGIGLTQSFSTDGDLATTRSLISVDNIIQSPIAVKPVGVAITMTDAVGIGSTQITVSDVSKIQGKSLLRFGDGEIVKVDLVGAGNVLNVQRGILGTVATAHTVGAASSVVTGDYRIKQGKIYFSDAPYGPAGIGSLTTRSSFSGRIFYRLSYNENTIFDDISDSFNSATGQFSIISSGVAVTGITTSHGVVLINNIFQKPFLSPIGALASSDYEIEKTLTGEAIDFTGTQSVGDLPQGGIINEFTVGVGSGYQVPSRALFQAVVSPTGTVQSVGIVTGGQGYISAPIVSIAATDRHFIHTFVSSAANSVNVTGGSQLTPTDATYISETGLLTLTIANHGLTFDNTVTLDNDSLVFRCSRDGFTSDHSYPRATDPAAGQTLEIASFTTDTITLNVGFGGGEDATFTTTVTDGTVTAITITNAGTGYTSTGISTTLDFVTVPPPSPYKGLTLSGGTGSGAEMDVVVGTGGSVISFNMSNRGVGYEEGDVLELQGLPFQGPGITTIPFTATVSNKYQDKFSGWTFGQLLEMDDFSNQFNGAKTQFLITRTETEREFYSIVAREGSGIILQNNLLIFINDILQRPGIDYEFNGGTRLKFREAPKADSSFRLYFYAGSSLDFDEIDVDQTIKEGDELRLQKESYIEVEKVDSEGNKFNVFERQNDVTSQDRRTIYALIAADTVETETYTGVGINSEDKLLRPIEWTKQTSDTVIDGLRISKSRNSNSALYFPSTKIIQPVGPTDTVIYAENVWSFDEVDNLAQSINNVTLVGLAVTDATLPVVETIKEVAYEGDFGQVIDIVEFDSGEAGAENSLPTIKFDFYPHPSIYSEGGEPNTIETTGISTGDYFVIRNTTIGPGAGLTSIDGSQANIVAVGSSFLNNVYRAAKVTGFAGTDRIQVATNVHSVAGINTDPEFYQYGTFSWGKINTGSRNGQTLGFQTNDPLSGVSTSAHVSRTSQLSSFYR